MVPTSCGSLSLSTGGVSNLITGLQVPVSEFDYMRGERKSVLISAVQGKKNEKITQFAYFEPA